MTRSGATTTIYSLDDYDLVAEHNPDPARSLGKPARKSLFEGSHVFATGLSWICLLVAYITVTPQLRLAWLLRFEGQIVVVGFLLGIMNLCTSTVVPHALLVLEGRFGRSSLQNYEALLQSRLSSPGASLVWRLTLGVFVALPLGLSVAYKRFLGGTSSASIAMSSGEYGIDFPRIGSWPPPGDAIYLLTTSMSPFLSASQYEKHPYPDSFPRPYGYNTLLLSDSSAAILDIPTQSTIAQAQAMLRESPGEQWNMSATVDAYVAAQDRESDFRTNDTAWLGAVASSVFLNAGMSAGYLYQTSGQAIAFMPADSNKQCFIGVYPNSSVFPGFETMYVPSERRDFALFRPRAQKFSLSRQRCHGRWQLNSTGIVLTGGACYPHISVNSSILQVPNSTPDPFDLLPELHYVFQGFAGSDGVERVEDSWLNVTYAVSVATAFWARALYMTHPDGNDLTPYSWRYVPSDESIVSTRPTLQASPLLFLTLAVQPVITILGLILAAWLHGVPIGRGFGIVSILSGLDPSTLHIVRGASLSGKLMTDVTLELVAEKSSVDQDAAVSYRLVSVQSRSSTRPRLRRDQGRYAEILRN